jgi:hypothetical protein
MSQSQSQSQPESQFVPRDDDEELLWEVEEIVAEKPGYYKVRWCGLDPKTSKPWPLDWVKRHDCTPNLVAEWKINKAEKERRSA